MAMGTRKQREKQEDIWIAHTELASAPGHPFYQRLNELLEAGQFDQFVEERCAKFYRSQSGRRSLTPGIYLRSLLIGYFESIDSERGIAWRLADSLALRGFVGIALTEDTPDHSTLSRTRRRIDVETHQEVLAWVLNLLAQRGLLRGQRIGIDATTLEAKAAMRSIVRRESGESYEEFLLGLAKASGLATPTREQLTRLERKRKKRMRNEISEYVCQVNFSDILIDLHNLPTAYPQSCSHGFPDNRDINGSQRRAAPGERGQIFVLVISNPVFPTTKHNANPFER